MLRIEGLLTTALAAMARLGEDLAAAFGLEDLRAPSAFAPEEPFFAFDDEALALAL